MSAIFNQNRRIIHAIKCRIFFLLWYKHFLFCFHLKNLLDIIMLSVFFDFCKYIFVILTDLIVFSSLFNLSGEKIHRVLVTKFIMYWILCSIQKGIIKVHFLIKSNYRWAASSGYTWYCKLCMFDIFLNLSY